MIPHAPRSTLFPYTTLFRSRSCTTGKDVKDELGPIDDFASEFAFKIPLLGRRKIAIEDNNVNRRSLDLVGDLADLAGADQRDRKSTRLNSSHMSISYAVFCL